MHLENNTPLVSFTICTNNYLAEALTLGQSLIRTGSQSHQFIIFLCDIKDEQIKYDSYNHKIIPLDNNIVPNFDIITKKYQLVELCTSVKPSVFKYLISELKETIFAYLDPDLYFFRNIDRLITELGNSSILLTPHVIYPKPIDSIPTESTFLNYGLYNLGFLMLRSDKNSLDFLNWWEERTLNLCFNRPSDGLFVDQLWINLIPIYYDQVIVSKNVGLNVAYWNLNERYIAREKKELIVNGAEELTFFHFSSFDYSLSSLSRRAHNISKSQWPVIHTMMIDYRRELDNHNITFLKTIKPSFKIDFQNYLTNNISNRSITPRKIKFINLVIKFLPKKVLQRIIDFIKDLVIILDFKKVV
ncbi:hypothetical protein QF042_004467 [Pedobacter sp. W3I1]|uniref:hypothetical protein n=1 Tax=Pedobacter sp. W3I1 TaxID=3042291 RepID=UPI0027807171|nr:hypothetical protein [Pedobacter sp. W3I1]MDQ0640902.1 hypothetical protein [Pedobacter sp. W3I1]